MKHLQRDLEQLKREVLDMGNMVETAMNQAIKALLNRDRLLAERIMAGDHVLDDKEVSIEENCLKMLALHQPVATDLRFIIAAMKVNNDLERMGDIAVNIAERAAFLAAHPAIAGLNFQNMTAAVQDMVRGSLDSLVNLDTKLAREICLKDDIVDDYNREMFIVVQEIMEQDPKSIPIVIHFLSVSRHLERIADLATNIAEDVVFMVDGEIIRHQLEDFA